MNDLDKAKQPSNPTEDTPLIDTLADWVLAFIGAAAFGCYLISIYYLTK